MINGTGNVVGVHIEDEMRQSYMDYAMSVIVGRALPDVRDGLKPVQRRILYAMFREGLLHNRKYSKCAGVVGELLKHYHPHGDIPVYDALVRLAQPWNLRQPLIDGQGNFGSIDGDSPAAYRYTEARMTELAEKLLSDIDKDTVDFIPNFDESTVEPIVLPTPFPNLLVNGSDGIAVGMAAHIPPHNLGEVAKATAEYIKNPNISLTDLMGIMPGPDFPTGGIICGRAGIQSAYAGGRGIIQIRAKTSIEPIANKKDCFAIIVHEIPYQGNKAVIQEKIALLVNEKKIEGISKIRDESDRESIRLVIELKREATPEVVLNQLFKLTPLQESFGIINLAIIEGKPVVCSLKRLLECFLSHRRDVIVRRTKFEIKEASARMFILEGFRIALLNLDEVIKMIRGSESPEEARTGLMRRFELAQIQAQAILDLKLQKLTGLERLAIEKEHKELAAELERLRAILADRGRVDKIITDELVDIGDKFSDTRRTAIEDSTVDIATEDLIEKEDVVLTVSHAGYIKRTAASSYRAQRRGGKGVIGASSREDDFIEHMFVASTHDEMLFFTSTGRLYSEKVYTIPEAGRTSKGRALINLLSLKEDEKITAFVPVADFAAATSVLMVTKMGTVKRVQLDQFSNVRTSGIIACSLAEGDTLIGVGVANDDDEVLLATAQGTAIRFPANDVRVMGRAARGVTGIKLDDGDIVIGMTVIPKDKQSQLSILSVSENGFGKRTALEEYRLQSRAGRGVINIQTSGRNGAVVSSHAVTDVSEAMLITSGGKIIRFAAKNLSVIGRNTQGVKLIELEPGEKVVGVAPIAESEGE